VFACLYCFKSCFKFAFIARKNYCFQVQSSAIVVRKGIHSHIESYSAFWDNAKLNETILRQDLKNHNITDVFICGIAYDHCVGEFIWSNISFFLANFVLNFQSIVNTWMIFDSILLYCDIPEIYLRWSIQVAFGRTLIYVTAISCM